MNAERRYLSAACLRRTAWGLLCGMLLAGCIRGEEQAGPEESSLVRTGEAAPDFTAAMTDGSSQRLSDLRGKVVLLTFWCTWCPTCQEEMAAVGKEAVERFAGRPFVFLPVSRGESLEEVCGYLAREGLGFPISCRWSPPSKRRCPTSPARTAPGSNRTYSLPSGGRRKGKQQAAHTFLGVRRLRRMDCGCCGQSGYFRSSSS